MRRGVIPTFLIENKNHSYFKHLSTAHFLSESQKGISPLQALACPQFGNLFSIDPIVRRGLTKVFEFKKSFGNTLYC